MPFDHSMDDDGGGGDDPRHDKEAIEGIVMAAVNQMNLNCAIHEVCMHCATIEVIQRYAAFYVMAVAEDNTRSGIASAFADALHTTALVMREEIAKCQTP